VSAAAAVGATSISLQLGAPATATDSKALVAGTRLTLGTTQVEVVNNATTGSGVYNITTTATTVNVKPITAAIAATATGTTYFAIQLCLKNANLTTSTTTVDNTTNCNEGLFTQVNVGVMKMLDLAGFLSSKDYGYQVLASLGVNLGSVYFVLDYDRKFTVQGTTQLTDPSITEAAVKQLVGWSLQSQVQSVDATYGSFLTTAQQTALATLRANYGLAPQTDIETVAVAV
jgi:hypothetical protein